MSSGEKMVVEGGSVGRERQKNIVTFTHPYDPLNPKDWPAAKKWLTVIAISFYNILGPLCTTIIAPSMPQITQDLHATDSSTATSELMLSIVFLGFGIGPCITSPLSELHGRVPVLQLGQLLFLIFSLACGFARTQTQMLAFRFFQGFGGSTIFGVGGGLIADMFLPAERNVPIGMYNVIPLVGTAFAPIVGAFVTEYASWRWSFWALAIADAVVQGVGVGVVRETWAPVLLERKRKKLVREGGDEALYVSGAQGDAGETVAKKLWTALVRPVKLFTTQLIMQVLCIYMAYIFGVVVLVLSTFSQLWEERYHYSLSIGSLNYLALAIGFIIGTLISAALDNRVWRHLKARNGGKALPEHRLPTLALGATFMPFGLLIYAWTAQYRSHWAAVDFGIGIFAAGVFLSFQCLLAYMFDTYTTYAASALAVATIMRSVFAVVFPLFAPKLYASLDYGWGNTTLALIAVVLGWPAPVLLWRFGPALRARSPYAAEQQPDNGS